MPKPKKPIIEKNFEKFINNNFDKRDKNKKPSLKFEWFVNSMHIWHCSSQFYNANTKVGQDVTLGDAQGGDAFFISVNNNEKIFTANDNVEDVTNFIKSRGEYVTFHFIQTKYSESVSWENFLSLIDVPLKIWKGQEFGKDQPQLRRIHQFIDEITNEEDSQLGRIKHKIEIHLYTKKDETNLTALKKDWATNIVGKVKDLEYYFGAGDESSRNVKIDIRGAEFLNTIYEKLNSNQYSLLINKDEVIEADDKNYLIGYLTAKELLNSIAPNVSGNRTLYLDVFKNNIRLYLGETNVNEKIEETIKKEPQKFHHYNNGLTITTKEIKDSDNSKNYIITPVNIVNGCQTANSVFNSLKSASDEDLKIVKIPVKIIIAKDKEYENITIRSNTQNGLQEKDLVSITNIQKDIEEEFTKTKFMDSTFHYKRQKSFIDNPDLNVDYIIQIDDILRATFSTLMLIPNKVSGYFDHTTLKYLDRIFDERFTKLYIITSVLLKFVENEIEDTYPTFVRHKYHVTYLIYRFLNKGENIKLIEDYFREDNEDLDEQEILEQNDLINRIYSNISKIFKSKENFNKILAYVIKKIEDNYPNILDLSDKSKEKILYKPVEKLKRTRITPIFENFNTIFVDEYEKIIFESESVNPDTKTVITDAT